jgi:molybdopterin synthase catalytic subunit
VKVRVLYFASFRDRSGASSTDELIREGATVGELWEMIRSRPAFAGALPRPGFSVNGEWAGPGEGLDEGDEVGLLPPVSGG